MSPATFSYAQAAKGLVSSNPSAPASKTGSGAITPAKDSVGSPVVDPEARSNTRTIDNLQQLRQKDSEHASVPQQLPSSADFTSQKPITESTGSISPPSMA